MLTKPGDGERRAAGGYRPQYLLGATLILQALERGDLEWIRVADPDAGRVDDIQIATTARLDAYQVKWTQYDGSVTLNDLQNSSINEPALFNQLAQGWKNLRLKYPSRRIIVHLATNRIPAYTSSGMPNTKDEPQPYTLSAFIEQAWLPAQQNKIINKDSQWESLWNALQVASGLSDNEFPAFVQDCSLDFRLHRPVESDDIKAICDLLFATAASPARIIQLDHDQLLARLGWAHRYQFRSRHEFPIPHHYLYRPIQKTIAALTEKLNTLASGYIGVFGPPGSGKSTFLTQTLRAMPTIRLIRYYAYVPDVQDPSVLRGESTNFFHDVTLRIWQIGFSNSMQPDPTDRIALINRFHEQLQYLSQDYVKTSMKTVILVDGLDHISREQNPERSLLADLPHPSAIPTGVYIIIGSQTINLPDLPPQISHLLQTDRNIAMEVLTPSDVYAIVQNALPNLGAEHQKKIHELSNGHPLALIYLLNTLKQTKTVQDCTTILEDSLPYNGDIEAQYFAHWQQIESDDALVELLGLLTRIRGPIPMKWVAKWAKRNVLKKLERLFVQYFSSDNQDRWRFFHNSFRLFLEAKTAEPLPGQTNKQIDQQFHLELAERYERSSKPWQWEALYHYFRAVHYQRVIDVAQYSWFRKQVESLRPIDAIETDVRLAMKAAGELTDAVALMRYTLIGASLQQRSKALGDTTLPHLLVDAGESYLAVDYARDGARLRIKEEDALRLAIHLFDAGLKRDALQIFELAEPLEYLSSRPIPDDSSRPENLWGLLNAWVESACVLRSPEETAKMVRRIQIEPSRHDREKDQQEASLELQNWLIHEGALACCLRGDQSGWQIFFNTLDVERDHQMRYFTLLHSIEHYRKTGQEERGRHLLRMLRAMPMPEDIGHGRRKVANSLSIAESYYFLLYDDIFVDAQEWLSKIQAVPLADQELSHESRHDLHPLQFRYARLKFLSDQSLQPQQLLREAESVTQFGPHEKEETKLARRQLHLIFISLAKLWVDGHIGHQIQPNAFLSSTKWIVDLIETGWDSQSPTFRFEVSHAKSEIVQLIIVCAAKHSQEVVRAIKAEFEGRWEKRPHLWWAGIRRDIVLELAKNGMEHNWLTHNLRIIESSMLIGLDLHHRIKECEEQAKAWLEIKENDAAIITLEQLVRSARGIYHDEDYQLAQWARWLRNVNKLDPSLSIERIRTFIRCIASLEGNASGVKKALNITLQMLFDRSPRRSIVLFQRLLERKTTSHQDGLSNLLIAALEAENPPVVEIFWVLTELLIPLVRGAQPELIKQLIIQGNAVLGRAKTVQMVKQIIHRIRVDAIGDQRINWFEGVHNGLVNTGVDPSAVELQPSDLEQPIHHNSDSNLDRYFYLKSGEKLSLQEVLDIVQTVDKLQEYLVLEERREYAYFEWEIVAKHLAERLSSPEELWQMESLLNARLDSLSRQTILAKILTYISKRLFKLGYIVDAENALEKALTFTQPSGWAINWDGGAKYTVMRQMLLVFGERFRNRLIKLYAHDLSEHFRNPEQILLYGADSVEILFADIPYTKIWPDIEAYLDELFAGSVIQPQPELEATLDESLNETESDSPVNALSDLLILFLDFPAYPVSNQAIRACVQALVTGSTAVQSSLDHALNGHDQLVRQALKVLDCVTLQDLQSAICYYEPILKLCKSPNLLIRFTANEVYCRLVGQSRPVPRVDRNVSSGYMIHLPQISRHDTAKAMNQYSNPVLVGDPALVLRPLDIEARILAELSTVADNNVLYRAAQKVSSLKLQRTWMVNNPAFTTEELIPFLSEVDLRFEHNKLHISPIENAIAHVAAELYDAGFIAAKDLGQIVSLFKNYDPQFYIDKPVCRPVAIERIGGLDYDRGHYINIPKDWLDSSQNSLALLKKCMTDGRIILGEWTKLKRLEENWPSEERMSLMRVTRTSDFWEDFSSESEGNPFAWVKGAFTTDYRELTDFQDSELVIAHNTYRFQILGANWLGFNPRIGSEMGWRLSEQGWFRWQDDDGKIVVESIWWQDGPFNLTSSYGHTEVGSGWLVLITDEGYQQLLDKLGNITRGGVVRRSLGWFGSGGIGEDFALLDLP